MSETAYEIQHSVEAEVSAAFAWNRATLSFEWRFDRLTDRATRLTQHICLSGANAGACVSQVESAFNATLRDGMERIARALTMAEAETMQVRSTSGPH